ncbi:MAG: ABC transporter ATP-binding protein, partial [Candidatus Riflebacteria bacterium]|nr:ABC transporter ATP-binding protein [Candidatus Riflebacteria bacterium]
EGFSTGMLQRLGLAFCLLGKPQMIVLDEPTSGMDPEYRVTVRELLRSLRKTGDTTVIVSSHLLFEVQEVADHLILIRDGQVVLQGPLKELLGERSGSRYLLRAEPLELVRQALEKVPHRESGDGFSLELERDKVPDLVAGLVRQGARIYELREERASLEDLYLTTAGSKGVAVQ